MAGVMGEAHEPYGEVVRSPTSLRAADDQRVALSAAAAQGRRAGAQATPLQLAKRGARARYYHGGHKVSLISR